MKIVAWLSSSFAGVAIAFVLFWGIPMFALLIPHEPSAHVGVGRATVFLLVSIGGGVLLAVPVWFQIIKPMRKKAGGS